MTELIDIYDGRYVYIWVDKEVAFITLYPNSITFSVPLEYLSVLFAEFARAQMAYQEMLAYGQGNRNN